MTYDFTRARAMHLWLLLVGGVAAIWAAAGPALGRESVTLLLGLSVVPPGILMLLRPGVEPPAAAEVTSVGGERGASGHGWGHRRDRHAERSSR